MEIGGYWQGTTGGLSDWVQTAKPSFWLKTKEHVKQSFSGRLEGMNEDMPGKANKKKAGFVISIADKVESKVK